MPTEFGHKSFWKSFLCTLFASPLLPLGCLYIRQGVLTVGCLEGSFMPWDIMSSASFCSRSMYVWRCRSVQVFISSSIVASVHNGSIRDDIPSRRLGCLKYVRARARARACVCVCVCVCVFQRTNAAHGRQNACSVRVRKLGFKQTQSWIHNCLMRTTRWLNE